MSNPAIQLFCCNGHPMARGADWCQECGEPPRRTDHEPPPHEPRYLDAARVEMILSASVDESQKNPGEPHMTAHEKDLGMLVQRCPLPASTGMDALEARVILLQEVPPKRELRFFAVRGEVRDLLTASATRALFATTPRGSIPPR